MPSAGEPLAADFLYVIIYSNENIFIDYIYSFE